MRSLRVFFGHQSVGDNILDGVRQIAPDLRIVRGEVPTEAPAIIETLIGRNEAPESKLTHFALIMQTVGDRVDVAMLTFCYMDFGAAADVEVLKQRYRDILSVLAATYRTRVVRVTVAEHCHADRRHGRGDAPAWPSGAGRAREPEAR